MRPYNTYRNPELSQPVSSVENTLADKTSNSNLPLDILRSLSESISVDCGSFEVSAPTECAVNQLRPESRQLRNENREQRENNAGIQTSQSDSAVIAAGASDADDDNYDCMNDPNYRAQCVKETNSPSFEELLARTAESIAKMREETDRVGSQLEAGSAENAFSETKPCPTARAASRNAFSETKPCPTARAASRSSFGNKTLSSCPRGFAPDRVGSSSDKTETGDGSADSLYVSRRPSSESVGTERESKVKPSVDSPSESSTKKRRASKINWEKARKLLFNWETVKLTTLSAAVCALIVAAVIYRNSPRRNNGLPESDDVVMNQSASEIQDVPVQGNAVNANNGEFNDSSNGNYWRDETNDSWASSDNLNPKALTDQMRGQYQSPTYDAAPSGIEYSQNGTDGYLSPEDAGRPLASPHNSNYGNQYEVARANGEAPFPNRAGFVDAMPVNNVGPQYAEAAPAIGSQYSPDEYESPVLEDDSVSEYSETGYNSNFMR